MALSTIAAYDKDRRTGKANPVFQHRHFAYIAKVISEIEPDDLRTTMALRFADSLQITNPNFDWERFMRAAKVKMED